VLEHRAKLIDDIYGNPEVAKVIAI
jgi:hypothetical protein